MTTRRHSATLQAAYSELVEQLQIAEIEGLRKHEGWFMCKKRKGKNHWYFRRRIGNRDADRYVGPETPELLVRIEALRAQSEQAKDAARQRRDLIRPLRAGGYLMTDRRTGRVLEELARAGVFRLNGVLIGTHAFRCYAALLGVRLEQQFALTGDVDIAQDRAVRLAIMDTANPGLSAALAKAEKFIAIPALNAKDPSTSWRTEDRELRVDVLTPLAGKPTRSTVELPALGVYAKPLRFLDFLLAETVSAAVLSGSGVLVRVPTPERYALHKLIVAQRRDANARDKVRKDLGQVETLLEVLLEDSPDDVLDAWADLVERGRKWQTEAMKSVRQLPKHIQAPFRPAG